MSKSRYILTPDNRIYDRLLEQYVSMEGKDRESLEFYVTAWNKIEEEKKRRGNHE